MSGVEGEVDVIDKGRVLAPIYSLGDNNIRLISGIPLADTRPHIAHKAPLLPLKLDVRETVDIKPRP